MRKPFWVGLRAAAFYGHKRSVVSGLAPGNLRFETKADVGRGSA